MKYELNQEVWFMRNDKIASAKVQARIYKDQISNVHSFVFEEHEIGTIYHLGNVWLHEDKLFATKQDLIESILK